LTCVNIKKYRHVAGGVGADRSWQAMERNLDTVYQNTTDHDIEVAVTFSSPGQGDNFCRFVLESAETTGSFITIGAVAGRIGGRWKNELWGMNAPILPGDFYRVGVVEAQKIVIILGLKAGQN